MTFESVRDRYKKTFYYMENEIIQRMSGNIDTRTLGYIPKRGYVVAKEIVLTSGKTLLTAVWHFNTVSEFDEFVTLLENQD